MKNLKIGKKLLVTFGVIVLLFVSMIALSLGSLNSTGNNFEKFYQIGYPVSLRTSEMRASMQNGLKVLSQSMLTEDIQKTQDFVSQARESFQEVMAGFDYLKQNFQGDKSVLDKAQSILTQTAATRDKILELAGQNQNEEASRLLFDEFQPKMVEYQQEMIAIDQLTAKLADDDFNQSERAETLTFALLIAASIFTVLLTVILATYITRSITKPVKEIEAAAKEMEQGKLKIDIEYRSRDELGSLAECMRSMAQRIGYYMGEITNFTKQLAEGDLNVKRREDFLGDFAPVQLAVRRLAGSLNDTLTQINQSADQVASGSDQVSSGAQALSQGATEQASSVQELAATINEISQQVNETARNAVEARSQTSEAGVEVEACNGQMQEMIAAMREISDKSNEIGKIIKTIEDIAFQTNILALNAAVEAARAGAAGKGFAVVADEVRNLASKSAEASKNTSALIEGSIQAVEKGTKIANDTAQSLQRVVKGTVTVSGTVDKITSATNEQANAVTQVTQGIDQISSVVQTNSATAEESAAASEELSGQAQMLRDLVGRFRLKKAGGPAAASAARENPMPQLDTLAGSSKY